ncbi:hypothetical protein SCALM49S_04152 [Streptomyces californicus]
MVAVVPLHRPEARGGAGQGLVYGTESPDPDERAGQEADRAWYRKPALLGLGRGRCSPPPATSRYSF